MRPISAEVALRVVRVLAALAVVVLPASASTGDGRFNKGYCFHGYSWGNESFWQSFLGTNRTRVAQLTTVNDTATYYLTVVPSASAAATGADGPALGKFELTTTPTNLSVDLVCQPRSLPDYSAVSLGTYDSSGRVPPLWAAGPIGDSTGSKVPRCFWVRCDVNETQSDFCGSEGESPCSKLDALFNRYVSPYSGGPVAPAVDQACYPIAVDSQVDPTHRVDFNVRFVDGLWPPHAGNAD
jgi:hypothetical protein